MSEARLPLQWETERLILRCYREQDAPWYYQMSLRNRDHLRRYESGNLAMSLASEQHTQDTLREVAEYWNSGICYFVGAFDKNSNEFVAQVYVGPFSIDPVDFIIGYIADVEHEGLGFVSEAVKATVDHIFSELGAEQVRIHCNETNERSRRVAERCGFRFERLFPEDRQGPDGQLEHCATAIYLRLPSNSPSS